MKTCHSCIHADPESTRWTGNGYTVGCNAKPDKTPIGYGDTQYNPDGSIKRNDKGMILLKKCYYYRAAESLEPATVEKKG